MFHRDREDGVVRCEASNKSHEVIDRGGFEVLMKVVADGDGECGIIAGNFEHAKFRVVGMKCDCRLGFVGA